MEQKLAKMMVDLIPVGTTITVAYANRLMEQAYRQLGLSQRASSNDLQKWFECSESHGKRIKGKVTKVVDIYRSKFIFELK